MGQLADDDKVLLDNGGKGGGGAVLSPEGELLLERYDELCRRMQAYGAQQYAELFGSGSESAE